jgi:type III pantothenate kinase
VLLIDIGNSRIKWARVRDGGRDPQRSAPLLADGRDVFTPLLGRLPPATPIAAVNVAGVAAERALRTAARRAGLPPPRLLRTARRAQPPVALSNGYRDPWRLGADRWAAMLGARSLTASRRPLCIVDIGTAMTVDFVDAEGRHSGGYIVPGPSLAVESLLAGTRGIARRAGRRAGGHVVPARGRDASWPRATLPAIERGALQACAAMILRCHASARAQWPRGARLVLTGGAAPAVLGLLPAGTLHVPDLVLAGVQAWHEQAVAGGDY